MELENSGLASPALSSHSEGEPGDDSNLSPEDSQRHYRRGSPQQLIQEMPDGLPGPNGPQPGPKYKRGRGRSFFKDQPRRGAVCQVPGCDRSLHKLRDYYKRYKICPYHLELPCLVVEGQTIRFCQQCGRFQLLTDFEGDRRSCRRKLDKHNERRRKADLEAKMREGQSSEESPGGTKRKASKNFLPGYDGSETSRQRVLGFEDPAADLQQMLAQLATDPTLQASLAPALLQGLQDVNCHSTADWMSGVQGLHGLANDAATQADTQVLPLELHALLPQLINGLPQHQQLQASPMGLTEANALMALLQHQPPSAPAASQAMGAATLAALSMGQQGGAQLQQQQQWQASTPQLPPENVLSSMLNGIFAQQQQQGGGGLGGSLGQQHHPDSAFSLAPKAPTLQPVPLVSSSPLPAAPSEAQPQQQQQQQAAAGVGSNSAAQALALLAQQSGVSTADLISAMVKVQGSKEGPAAGAAPQAPLLVQSQTQQPALPQIRSLPVAPEGASPQAPSVPMPQLRPVSALPSLDAPSPVSLGGPGSMSLGPGSSQASLLPPAPSPAKTTASIGGSVPAGQAPSAQAAPSFQQSPVSQVPQLQLGALDLRSLGLAVSSGGLNSAIPNDAVSLLSQLAQAMGTQQHQHQQRMHSLSLKLFECTPDLLPPTLIKELECWMACNPTFIESSQRPGCVHLHVNALLDGPERAQVVNHLESMVTRLLAASSLGQLPGAILVQQGGKDVSLFEAGEVVLRVASSPARLVPQLHSLRPLAVMPGYRGPLLLTGRHISGGSDAMYCRRSGQYPLTEVVARGSSFRLGPNEPVIDVEWVQLCVPDMQAGCYEVEAQHGLCVSKAQSFLVLDDADAVAELRSLEHASQGVGDIPEFLQRVDLVLRYPELAAAGQLHPSTCARIASVAREVSVAALVRGWPALMRLALPVTVADGASAEEAVEGMESLLGGVPLLHAAATTGMAPLVAALGQWGSSVGHSWSLSRTWGSSRITALHVAALLTQPEGVAMSLTALEPHEHGQWAAASCEPEGSSQFDTLLMLAWRLGKYQLVAALAAAAVPEAVRLLARLQGGQGTPTHSVGDWDAAGGSGSGSEASEECVEWAEEVEERAAASAGDKDLMHGGSSPTTVVECAVALREDDTSSEGEGGAAGQATLQPAALPAASSTPHVGSLEPLSPADTSTEERFARWHSSRLAKTDALLFLIAPCLLLIATTLLSLRAILADLPVLCLGVGSMLPPVLAQPLVAAVPRLGPLYARYRSPLVLAALALANVAHHVWQWSSAFPRAALLHGITWNVVVLMALQLPFNWQAASVMVALISNLGLIARLCCTDPAAPDVCFAPAAVRLALLGAVWPLLAARVWERHSRWRCAAATSRPRSCKT